MSDRQAILAKLATVLEEDTGTNVDALLENEDISIKDGLMLDSVDLVGMIMRIEEAYRIRFAKNDLEPVSTIRHLVDLIETKIAMSRTTATA